jgi:hypothetical protein
MLYYQFRAKPVANLSGQLEFPIHDCRKVNWTQNSPYIQHSILLSLKGCATWVTISRTLEDSPQPRAAKQQTPVLH